MIDVETALNEARRWERGIRLHTGGVINPDPAKLREHKRLNDLIAAVEQLQKTVKRQDQAIRDLSPSTCMPCPECGANGVRPSAGAPCYPCRIEQLQAEVSTLKQAIGLMTTAKPDLVMDPNDPIGMARAVVAEVERLKGGGE